MSRITVKEFAKNHGFNIMSAVRENTNGYKYVTFINSAQPDANQEGGPQNIYFGQRFAKEGGYNVGDRLKNDEVFLTFVTYDDGRASQWKLTDKSGDAKATLLANGYYEI